MKKILSVLLSIAILITSISISITASASEHEKAAEKVIKCSTALTKKEAEDGDDIYYIEATNEIVFVRQAK